MMLRQEPKIGVHPFKDHEYIILKREVQTNSAPAIKCVTGEVKHQRNVALNILTINCET